MDKELMRKRAEMLKTEWKGDLLKQMDEETYANGQIRFNIPNPKNPDSLNGEGVWGWCSSEDKEKFNDDSYEGKITAILDNRPLHYAGVLIPGLVVTLRCHGEYRPTLDPDWVQEHLIDTGAYLLEEVM